MALKKTKENIQTVLTRAIQETSVYTIFVAVFSFFMLDLVRTLVVLPHDLRIQARIIAENVRSSLVFSFPEAAEETLSALHINDDINDAIVYDAEGTIFARLGKKPYQIQEQKLGQIFSSHYSLIDLEVLEPVLRDQKPIGYVYVSASLRSLYYRMGLYISFTAISLLIAVRVSRIVGKRKQRTISDPVVSLTDSVEEITYSGKYASRVLYEPHIQELDILVNGLNDMLSEIQHRDDKLREHQSVLENTVDARTRELQKVNAELLQATQMKSEFLASMSHELRTPLNAILGFSQLMQMTMRKSLNEKQLTYIQHIHDSGQHLLALIDDILDLSRVEAGKLEFNPSRIKVRETIENTLLLVQEKAKKRQTEIHYQVDERAAEFVVDELRYRQILLNLLSNAIKFTGPSGRIDIRVRKQDKHVCTEVQDNGIGISELDQKRVFEPFQQPNESDEAGTGLGLTIVKQFVELQGGLVGVESQPGKGSTFWFSIPEQEVNTQDVEEGECDAQGLDH